MTTSTESTFPVLIIEEKLSTFFLRIEDPIVECLKKTAAA